MEPETIIKEAQAEDLLTAFRKRWNEQRPKNRFNLEREEFNEVETTITRTM